LKKRRKKLIIIVIYQIMLANIVEFMKHPVLLCAMSAVNGFAMAEGIHLDHISSIT
jgi:hypothetical protein